uniref:Uncharacterized protein n=1 Tax=Cyanothece sp. (strain PCC 7425 / ATCC 29141) TaxID=395961 RepID=B8HWX2_CYAP4
MPLNGTERIDPAAIVRLSHAQSHLYAEVIQVMAERQMGWLRPLLLAEAEDESGAESPVPVKIHDLRQGADLLWPLDLLEPALDTEVLPLFSQLPPTDLLHLNGGETGGETAALSRRRLHQFMQQLWQANPVAFQLRQLEHNLAEKG